MKRFNVKMIGILKGYKTIEKLVHSEEVYATSDLIAIAKAIQMWQNKVLVRFDSLTVKSTEATEA